MSKFLTILALVYLQTCFSVLGEKSGKPNQPPGPKPTFPTLIVPPGEAKANFPPGSKVHISQQKLHNITERVAALVNKFSPQDPSDSVNNTPCSLQFVDVNSRTRKSDLFIAGYGHVEDLDDPLFFCKVKNALGYGYISQPNAFGEAEEYACRIFLNKTSSVIVRDREGLKMLKKPDNPSVRYHWVRYWPKNLEGNLVYTELGNNGVVAERVVKVDRDLYLGRCDYHSPVEKINVLMPGYIALGAARVSMWSTVASEIKRCPPSNEQILSCKIL